MKPEPSATPKQPERPTRRAAVVLDAVAAGHGGSPVLREVSFTIEPGQFFAVVGPNGSGKTTLLRTLLGVIPPIAGSVACDGRMGYVPQRQSLDDLYPFTAGEVVAHGLLPENLPRAVVRSRAESVLRRCGVEDRVDQPFRDLSGGQKQRVLIARALVTEPDILVLDEPTNDLDARGEAEVLSLVRSLHGHGTTVILVSHQLPVVAELAESIAFIADGSLTYGAREQVWTAERLESLYGVAIDLSSGRPRVGGAP